MKTSISATLTFLLVICLFGIHLSAAPVRAQNDLGYRIYLPQINRRITTLESTDSLAIGIRHGCAITPAGGVKCWGIDDEGQLGNGSGPDMHGTYAVIELNARVKAVSAGTGHTCALTENGGVKCWGSNVFGQLGDGTTTNRYAPVDVVGLSSGVKTISAGEYHTCALMEDGRLLCWGTNAFGELGDGTTVHRYTPVRVTVLTDKVRAINAGGPNCALTESGGVKCWGMVFGGTGDGTYVSIPDPVDIDGLTSGMRALSSGHNLCAITDRNQIKCWEFIWTKSEFGQWEYRIEVSDAPGFSDVISVSVHNDGRPRYCVLTASNSDIAVGGAKCWGNNSYGEVGNGTSGNITITPTDVIGLTSGVLELDTTFEYSCAKLASGGIKCWGYNHFYQLGTGSNIPDSSPIPLDVANFP